MAQPMERGQVILPHYFASEEFARLNHELFDKYVEFRVMGYQSSNVLVRVFGNDYMNQNVMNYINNIESNPYYIAKFTETLASMKTEELWNEKIALHELLSLARSPFVKDSVRLAAQRELNLLVGIVISTDQDGARRSMSNADYYANAEEHRARIATLKEKEKEAKGTVH